MEPTVGSQQHCATIDATFGIIECILDNEGGLVLGFAGPGNSTIVNALKVVLNAIGHKVKICSYTTPRVVWWAEKLWRTCCIKRRAG